MGFSGNHLTSDNGENLPRPGTPGDLLSSFADRGDEAAFAEIVRRYAGMVFATCLKSTKDAHDAEDATQAVFLSLAVQCKTGKVVRALGPWLKQVAKRAGLDVRKSRRRRERREQAHAQNTAIELGCPDGILGTPAPRLTEYAQAASDPEELQRLVAQELNGLPATYRLPLISQYFGGLSQKQIATQLGIKPGAVAVRIHRGRVMLAKRLETLGADLPPGWTSHEEDPSMCACIGSAVSAMMVARIAESMGRMGLGYNVSGNVSSSLMSIARTAAAGAAAAAKLKIAVAVVLCLGFAASATTWAKNINLDIDFNGFPSLRPVIDFLRTLRGSGIPTRMMQASPAAPISVAATAPAFARPTFALDVTRGAAFPTAAARSPGPAIVTGPSAPRIAPPAAAEPLRSTAAVALLHSGTATASMGGAVARSATDTTADAQPISSLPSAASGSIHHDQDLSAAGFSRIATGDVEFSKAGWLYTALSGSAESVVTPGGQLSIASKIGSVGSLVLHGGNFVADAQDIGRSGAGRLEQADGINTAQQINLGAGPTGSGVYELASTAVLRPSPRSAGGALGILIGGAGDGELKLGNETSPGMVFEPQNVEASAATPAAARLMGPALTPFADPAHLIVRSDASGTGLLHGWGGAVGQDTFVNNGVVIADGYGRERSLVFTGYSSVTNTIDNLEKQGNGWYARDGGRLRLPKLRTEAGTHTYTWGEDPNDATLDLVNSVRVTLHDMPAADSLEINLLDKTRSDVPTLPTGHTFIGVWTFDTLAARPDTVDLSVRYDDGLAEQLKLNEGGLKLWEYVNGVWIRLDHDPTFVRDTPDHILSVTADGSLTFFAVSAPEPGSASIVIVLGGAALLRRRARR